MDSIGSPTNGNKPMDDLILVWPGNMCLCVEIQKLVQERKVRGLPNLEFNMWGTWMSVPNATAIHPTFQTETKMARGYCLGITNKYHTLGHPIQ